jgi:protein-S-isoprenylcysteine O-methyltransferase Ste14
MNIAADTDVRGADMTEQAEARKKDNPGVIEPPPLIFAVILLIMLGIDGLIKGPGFGLSSEMRLFLALVFAIAGMTLIIMAGVKFRAYKTYIEPWKPTMALITDGVYAYSRNPVYVGMTLGYVGLSFLGDSILALAALPLPLLIVHYGVVLREERYLEAKFGDSYRQYRNRVRRYF